LAELSAHELNEAEDLWIKDVQNNVFPEEIKQLINGTKSSGSRVNQLRLFLDDKKIIHCEGRIYLLPLMLRNRYSFQQNITLRM
jgi:hypothetical protein